MKKNLLSPLFCLGFILLLSSCETPSSKKAVPGPQDKIYSVSTTQVLVKDIPNLLELKGSFTASQRLTLKSEFNGKVQGLSVSEGQLVSAGETLFKIEDEKLPWILDRQKAELKEAEAQLELETHLAEPGESEEALDRMRELQEEQADLQAQNPNYANGENPQATSPENLAEAPNDTGSGDENLENKRRSIVAAMKNRFVRRNPSTVTPPTSSAPPNPEQAESRIAVAQAKVDRIKAEIALTEKQIANGAMTAAFDGFIAKLNVTEGAVVKVDDPLAEIIHVDPLELSLRVPQDQIAKINKSAEVKVRIADIPDQAFKGEITFIGAELDPKTKTLEIRVKVANPKLAIKVGMEGVAQLGMTVNSHQAMMVPTSSVVNRGNRQVVYKLSGSVAREQKVGTGITQGDLVEIKEGLQASDQVVTQGLDQLKNEEEFVRLVSF